LAQRPLDMDAPMAGFHLVFCADPAATGIMIYEAASAYKEAGLLRTGDDPRYLGAPSGKRNGQYRHGERTKAAIAERQKFSELPKMLRAGLT